MRRRFFVDQFDGDIATMRGDAARHLSTVLRAEVGQQFELSDGAQLWLAEIKEISRNKIAFSMVESLPYRENSLRIELLLSIVKFDRFEWAIEKATELGVHSIVPVAADRSENGLIAAAPKRSARWQKIILESAQQSRRLSAPTLGAVSKSGDAFKNHSNADSIRILLSETKDAPSLRNVVSIGTSASSELPEQFVRRVVLAIGPEGGWTPAEFQSAETAQFRQASLGSLILRTETAVAAAIASVNYALGA